MGERRKCSQCDHYFVSAPKRKCAHCLKANRRNQVRKLHVGKAYNLTERQHKALVDWCEGRCHGCGETRSGNLCVDHDHATGLVRGLLCRRCNRVLGIMRDNAFALERLSEYLVDTPAEQCGITVQVNAEHAERPRRGRRGF